MKFLICFVACIFAGTENYTLAIVFLACAVCNDAP